MKILAIDDQQLILLSVEKKLLETGYEVRTANSGQEGVGQFDSFGPHLVLVDMNMPGISGMDVIRHIREVKKSKTPILVLSGNTEENVIVDGFNLGIDDYLKKPVGLDEIIARVKRMIGVPKAGVVSTGGNEMVQKHCVGVVIPCYNEADRLSGNIFQDFSKHNLGYHLCFVNDGSTDNTLDVLKELRKGREDHISIYNCKKNGGKAEAVRQGMLHLAQDVQLNYIGFLDADLSTDFRDFDDLVQTLESSNFKIVSGSRMSRMGANITKESARKIISMTINLIIRSILRMPFNDTQCGAKVMDHDLVVKMFAKPFITKWLFDVEVFMRMRKYYGAEKAKTLICEQPLKRWIHADGSKLSMKDSIKIVGQLARIAISYR